MARAITLKTKQISSAKSGMESLRKGPLAAAVGGGVAIWPGAPVAPRRDWNGVAVWAKVGVAVTPSRD